MKRDERLVRLSREHTQALMLALRLRREAPAAASERLGQLYSELLAFWAAGLMPHFTAEGECLLARLVRHIAQEDEHVQRLERDHLALFVLVAELRDTADLELRRAALVAFAERIEAHVRWEERDLFPFTETTLTEPELDALGNDLAVRLPEQPLPAWVEPPR